MNSADVFDEEYFEKGISTGKSLYEGFNWMPGRSIMEAQAVINALKLQGNESVLDFGCAKGFFVKAMRLLGYDACGLDISKYAIEHGDTETQPYLFLDHVGEKFFDVGFCKDVLEHTLILLPVLKQMASLAHKWLVIVPLGDKGKYRISDYFLDRTHIIAENEEWWIRAFRNAGFKISWVGYEVPGIKENWTKRTGYEKGNLFLLMEVNEL